MIVDLIAEFVPDSDVRQLCDQFPESEDDENWRRLFEIVDADGRDDTAGRADTGTAGPDDRTEAEDRPPVEEE